MEILLRSGANMSIPNNDGKLPVELSSHPEVRELFLRDRSGIFSPMVQAREVIRDYVAEFSNASKPSNSETQGRTIEGGLNIDINNEIIKESPK